MAEAEKKHDLNAAIDVDTHHLGGLDVLSHSTDAKSNSSVLDDEPKHRKK